MELNNINFDSNKNNIECVDIDFKKTDDLIVIDHVELINTNFDSKKNVYSSIEEWIKIFKYKK